MASDAGTTPEPSTPASTDGGPAEMAAPATPAAMALPVNPLAGDASSSRKFYTLTASLREAYDDNVNTSHYNPQSSFETELSPSILVDFPTPDSDFSARYTFDITYYSNANAINYNGSNNNNNTGTIEYTHEFIAQYTHAFSDRFNLNVAEDFRYFLEPSIFESVGTNYQNGSYVSNVLNGTLNSQWTPLFGTTSTYSNTIIRYDNANVALVQNSIENTGSQAFIFTIIPKISLSIGAIGDNITYDDVARGYTTYTGFAGPIWQVLPSLNVLVRGGGSYTETAQNQTLITPYAAVSIDWTLGARSALSFNYSHEVVPTDIANADAETADRISTNFRYDITPSLSSHLQGILTVATIPSVLYNYGGGFSNYTENDYALDTGLTYHYNSYLDLNCGITLSGVSANISTSDYTRNGAYFGIRGTY